MDILRLLGLKKKQPVLVRCTNCYYDFYLSPREVRLLESQNANDPVCSVKEECHVCHIGFMIPVKYTDKSGKTYLYHEIKPKIKNLDPNTVMERIMNDDDAEIIMFFPPSD